MLTTPIFLRAEKRFLLKQLRLSHSCLGDNSPAVLPTDDPYAVGPVQPMTGESLLSRSRLSFITPTIELRNINPMSITYASQPRLRSRLTLPGRAVCRNPWAYGDRDSHPVYRYSFQQQLLSYLHQCLRSGFTGLDNAPLPRKETSFLRIRSFGSTLQPRYVFGAAILDQ